jgi:beta-mannosidase
MARKDIKKFDDDSTGAFFSINQEVQLWACNSTLEEKKAKIELVSFDLNGEEVDRQSFGGKLAHNASTEIWKGDVPGKSLLWQTGGTALTDLGQPVRKSDAEVPKPIVVQARLLDPEHNDSVLARYSNWPEPWKYLTFPKDPKLTIKVDGDTVTLKCEKPIKGVILDLEDRTGEEVKWSDQAIDMFPGDTQVLEAKGLKGRKVKARYIGDGTA